MEDKCSRDKRQVVLNQYVSMIYKVKKKNYHYNKIKKLNSISTYDKMTITETKTKTLTQMAVVNFGGCNCLLNQTNYSVDRN